MALAGSLALTPWAVAQSEKAPPDAPSGSSLVTALRFTHQYGLTQALTPAGDRPLKLKLTAALGRSDELPWEAVSDYFDKTEFQKLAGGRKSITVAAMERLLQDHTPPSQKDMTAKIRQHADLLSTQFDLIEEAHRKPADELITWITKNYQPGKPLGVIVICTRNTRRSMLGATMGNIAASYHGLPDLRFYSGGVDPEAFNPRSLTALQAIGVEIEPTGKEAPRGKEGRENPIYRVRWGKGLETVEFSKKYTDAHNPQEKFAAVLVCSEADTNCPMVTGAAVRVPVPYLDPKAYDGATFEAAKYAERRDDEGRFMLSVLMQARRRLELDGKLK